MNPLESVDAETLLAGLSDWLDADAAEALAHHPLDSVETEFPHFIGSIDDPEEFEHPSKQHPVFYGCFDWHSSVHSHWCLVRLLRLFDDHPDEADIVESIDRRVTSENVAGEVAYFEEHQSFEKPYGWAWLLRLAAELHLWDDDRAAEWRETLRPLEERIVELVEAAFLTQNRPFRVGTHHNSAFALTGIIDYARVTSNDSLESAAVETSRRFFEDDEDAPVAYEPLGWDFVSPSLTEADLMRRVLDGDGFRVWLEAFLPDLRSEPHHEILDPVEVDSGTDSGIELHLVGLNLAKAWCLAGLADELEEHRYHESLRRSAERHAERGVNEAFTDDYAGAHWLSSFVLYLVTRNEGGIAPA